MTRPGLATDRMSDGWEETRFGGFFVACDFYTVPASSLLLADECQQREQRQACRQQRRA